MDEEFEDNNYPVETEEDFYEDSHEFDYEVDAMEVAMKLEKCIEMAQKINFAALKLDFPTIRELLGEISNTIPETGYPKKANTGPNGTFIFNMEAAEFFMKYSMEAYWRFIKAYKKVLDADLEGATQDLDGIQGIYGEGLNLAHELYAKEYPADLRYKGIIEPV